MSSSSVTMATTTTPSVSSPAGSSSTFPMTISPLNALSSAFPPANLSIHSGASRSDPKDLSQTLPQSNKKQSTPITPLGIIKPIISITPVGSSPSPTNSSGKSHSTSTRNVEVNSSNSPSNNSQGKGNKKSERSSRSTHQETHPLNPFMPFISPLNYLGNGSQTNEQALMALSQEMLHPLAKFFPSPELLCNPFAPKSKFDVNSHHAILSLEKISKMNERRLRSSHAQDFSQSLTKFPNAHPDLLCSSFTAKPKHIPQSALSLVTNGKHERISERESKSSSSGRRKWSSKEGGSDDDKTSGHKPINCHVDNRHHSRGNEMDVNSHSGIGVSLSDSITLTPVSPTSPSNAPLNLSLKPAPASETSNNSSQALHSIPQMLAYKGAKRGPKPKQGVPDDWQKLSQSQEALKSQMEAHLMQQHFKLSKNNSNKAHQGNSAIPPQILIQTNISPDNSVVITTSSNDALKSHHHHHSSINSKSSQSSSRPAISILSSSSSRFHDFPSSSIHDRIPSPRTSSHSPSRASTNGSSGVSPHFLSQEDRRFKSDALHCVSTDEDSSGSEGESESGSESETSNESDRSSSGSDKSRETSSSRGQKRESGGDSPPRKRRKYIVSDERELRIPLEHGWRRLTKIRAYSYSGVRGEVIYYAPCGKKLKTYPEVVRYLEKNGIDDITRDNFTFSSKHNVGEFMEPLGNGEYLTIGELEVISRIEEFRAHRSRRYVPVSERSEHSSRSEHSGHERHREKKLRQMEEVKLQQQLEEQAEEGQKKVETVRRSRRKDASSSANPVKTKAAEMRRQREHSRFLRMQEKIDRQEQLRVEREVRAQQLFEERKRRQDLLEKQRNDETMRRNKVLSAKEKESKRLQAVVLKEQEMQKRREMLVIVDLERERRRQHMLLVKALEARKRQEERDRMKEEKILEKQMQRERKMEQRQMEMHILREMKKPVEDMELKDIDPLPNLDRIPGVKLAGKAFADTLMVFEFLHNFGEALGFDMESLPTLNTLQLAVLNDESCEEELLSLLHHLLICAIEDPGIPAGSKPSTIVGQSLKEMDITSSTISEVLRIYIHANEGEKSQYLEWINRKPFLALNPTQKAAILAFLCNELLCSKAIIRQIDNNIEGVNNMRRDRWVVEGKVRNLKLIQNKKIAQQLLKEAATKAEEERVKETSEVASIKKTSPSNGKDEEVRNDSGNESEGSHEIGPAVADTEQIDTQFQGETVEEIGKQIDKLVKQQNQFRKKLQKTSQQIRALSFGQDRFRRRYWLLPNSGGIFVEGLESAEFLEDLPPGTLCGEEKPADPNQNEIKEEKSEIQDEKLEIKVEKSEMENSDIKEEKIEIKEEQSEIKEENLKITKDVNDCNLENAKSASQVDEECNMEIDAPLVVRTEDTPIAESEMKSTGSNRKESTLNKADDEIKSEDKADEEKDETVETKLAVTNSETASDSVTAVPQCHINAEKIIKNLEEKSLKPWFSILPRMPCDETSLTRLKALQSTSPPLSNNAFVKHSNESWVSPFANPQQQFQFPGGSPAVSAATSLPQFSSPFSFLSNYSMYFQNSPMPMDMLTSSSLVNSPSYLFSRYASPFSNFSSPGMLSESELNQQLIALNQLNQPPGEIQPIPQEFQNGWWRITNPSQLRLLHTKLHPRGIREKLLQMKLEKYMDVSCEVCTKASPVSDLEITDLDREISQMPGGTQIADKEDDWSWEMALRVDLAILEQVENLEEKVLNASMQNKHWRLASKATEDEEVIFYPACGDPEQCKEKMKSESQNENKVFRCTLTTARQRLLELEENLERRYIKPPLGYGNTDVSKMNSKRPNSSINSTMETVDENDMNEQPYSPEIQDVTEGLLKWRAAVQNARTSSQLAVCLNYLESFIAWDRSIMKACCQFCHCDDNEAMLLLCDGCDKGYHTYCFKPKMETIPDGDWFCFECLNKATGDRVCIVCGKKGKSMCVCDSCPKAYHTDCLEPPLSRAPKSRWLCPHCRHRTIKGKSKSKKSGAKDGSDNEDTPKRGEKSGKSESKPKEKNKNGIGKDLTPCRSLLADLETHEDAWPFLLPVNTKLFPSYRKVIRKPVDLSTIHTKLENGSYKARSDFMSDVQLIFKNCETFNEDDSPVGKAGHSLRAFFEARWSEINSEK